MLSTYTVASTIATEDKHEGDVDAVVDDVSEGVCMPLYTAAGPVEGRFRGVYDGDREVDWDCEGTEGVGVEDEVMDGD